MDVTRRGFLKGMGGILAAAAAPAIVRADALMRIVPTSTTILLPDQAIQTLQVGARQIGTTVGMMAGRRDAYRARFDLAYRLPDGTFRREELHTIIPDECYELMIGAERNKAAAILQQRMQRDFGVPVPPWVKK